VPPLPQTAARQSRFLSETELMIRAVNVVPTATRLDPASGTVWRWCLWNSAGFSEGAIATRRWLRCGGRDKRRAGTGARSPKPGGPAHRKEARSLRRPSYRSVSARLGVPATMRTLGARVKHVIQSRPACEYLLTRAVVPESKKDPPTVRCRKLIHFTANVDCWDGLCSSIRRGIRLASD